MDAINAGREEDGELIGAALAALVGAGVWRSEVGAGVAARTGGVLGGAFAVWRIRRPPEGGRVEDDGGR